MLLKGVNLNKFILLVTLFFTSLFAESFITEEEYGKYLYNNPRGVSCSACHGENAAGKVIASYIDKGTHKTLQTKAITNLEYEYFSKALKKRKGVMPRYYLSDKETKALHNYVKSL